MKTILALLLFVFFCRADLPDRWNAELAGAKPATLSSYSNGGTRRRPWRAEFKTEDGRTFTNSDNWSFRYLRVGEKTEWTQARKVYAGGFFLRWSIYAVVSPLILAFAAYDLIRIFRGRRSSPGEHAKT